MRSVVGRRRCFARVGVAAAPLLFMALSPSAAAMPLSDRVTISGALTLDLISVGFRMVDLIDNDESVMKVLTLLDGADATARVGIRFRPHRRLSVGARYQARITRVSAWDYLGSWSNDLLVTASVLLG